MTYDRSISVAVATFGSGTVETAASMMEICRAEVLRRVENARRQRSRASRMTNTSRDIGVWAVPTEPHPNFILK